MTKLDETDGDGGENVNLEALKSLAYEGDPDEIASNFKNQGIIVTNLKIQRCNYILYERS